MADEQQGYRAPQVGEIIGISYRQLDYWDRTGLVKPSIKSAEGSGTQRLYSFQDLLQLKVIKQLLDAGVSLQKVRKAVEYLQGHLREQPQGLNLLSDGDRIYAAASPGEVFDVLQKGQGVFAIAVDRVWSDLEGSVKKAAKAGRSPRAAGAGRA
ncbi:MAG TPA: MerR family transcriptional regulator [Actinomycetota bacterium]|nr:MerR family transcriptional regulator [Actinomycetota bacterium]